MPEATIVIVTRNRKEIAKAAVESALAQRGDVEVILMDDGSTDNTFEFIKEQFPSVRIYRSEVQEGYIVHRTRSAELALSPVIVSIDDDAVLVGADVIQNTLRMFDDPRIGAVAIPHFNFFVDGSNAPWWPPLPDGRRYVVSSFIGTAYALRVNIFKQLGGFHNDLFHWGEETEFCQRLYGAGYAVRLANSGLVHHFPHAVAGKYSRKVNRYILRNIILSAWMNAPLLYLFPAIGAALLRAIWRALRGQSALASAEGFGMAIAAILRGKSPRRPISSTRYQTWLRIRNRRIVPFDEIIDRLAPSPVTNA